MREIIQPCIDGCLRIIRHPNVKYHVIQFQLGHRPPPPLVIASIHASIHPSPRHRPHHSSPTMQGFNKYYPPDFDPQKTQTLNDYRGVHALGKRAKDIDKGILVVRFELPYNIWCGTCNVGVMENVPFLPPSLPPLPRQNRY